MSVDENIAMFIEEVAVDEDPESGRLNNFESHGN